MRNRLERAIAKYIASGIRPIIHASTRRISIYDILYLEDTNNDSILYTELQTDLHAVYPTPTGAPNTTTGAPTGTPSRYWVWSLLRYWYDTIVLKE